LALNVLKRKLFFKSLAPFASKIRCKKVYFSHSITGVQFGVERNIPQILIVFI
jgi:hypothetical protein